MKKCSIFVFVMLFVALMSFNVSALTVSDTYSDVSSTSSQAVNLVNYAANYKSFVNSDFVVFCDAQYSYYIVWGELEDNNGVLSGTDVEYIHYYRTDNYNSYSYEYGTETSFGLKPDNLCTTNIDGYGFKSAVYSEYEFQNDILTLSVFLTGFIFVIMILKLRGHN